MYKRLLPLLFAVLAVLATACGDASLVDAGSDTDNGSGSDGIVVDGHGLDGSWILSSGTLANTPIDLLADHPVTMTIEGSEIGGRAACNHYGGTLSAEDGAFGVGDLAWTEMGCEPAIATVEAQFLEAFQNATAAHRDGDELRLTGVEVELLFTIVAPIPTAELVGTTWVLDTLLSGDAASSTISGAEPATLVLAEDGTFTGHTGCRSLAGEYLVTSGFLQFPSWGADGVCPTEFQSQDSAVVSVLEDGLEVLIDGDRLTLHGPGGDGLSYRARP